MLAAEPADQPSPERERQLEGSNEAQKALGACRLCAYLCGTPQRLLHDKVEHTRLATKVTDRTCLSRAQCPSRLPSLHILGSTTTRLVRGGFLSTLSNSPQSGAKHMALKP